MNTLRFKSSLIVDAEKRASADKIKVAGLKKQLELAPADAGAGRTVPGGKSSLIVDAEKRARDAKIQCG